MKNRWPNGKKTVALFILALALALGGCDDGGGKSGGETKEGGMFDEFGDELRRSLQR